MTYEEYIDRKRAVLFKIEEILNSMSIRCSDSKVIGDVGFWTGIAYKQAMDFFVDVEKQMFPKDEKSEEA